MDSAKIIVKLEALYPSPSLHLNPELEQEADAAMGKVFQAIVPYVAPKVVNEIVPLDDTEWFKQDRARRFGITVEQLMTEQDKSTMPAALRPGYEQVREVLTRHKKDHGPFILGSTPSYADFYLVSTLAMIKQIDEDISRRSLEEGGPEVQALFEACEKWIVKQD